LVLIFINPMMSRALPSGRNISHQDWNRLVRPKILSLFPKVY
jgi:hypothetical protein